MLASSIAWLLVATGIVTGIGGLAALLFPQPLLRSAFAVENAVGWTLFFVRHWGLLILLVGALTVHSASDPAIRPAVLTAAAIEKFGIVLLVFFGPIKRTIPMTAIAIVDGLFAVLYVAYLAGI